MYSMKVDASTANIPTSFDETAGSLMSAAVAAGNKISFINTTTKCIAWAIGSSLTTPVSTLSTNRNQGFIPPAPSGGCAGIVFDLQKASRGDRLYIRSDDAAAATTGIVRATIG